MYNSHTNPNPNPNLDQDTKSDLAVISLWGSWLTYDNHQERPSDAELYKYTASANLVPTVGTRGLKWSLEKQVELFVTAQKAFGKAQQPPEL